MIVDTSILAAIALDEEDAHELLAFLQSSSGIKVSAVSLVELHIVLIKRIGELRTREINLVINGLGLEIVPVDHQQMALAQEAFTRFGKGRHPAALNFGDCFSYALAKALDEHLLFKGDDFSQTDVRVA